MQSLQSKASELSGVPLSEAFSIDEVNLYERLGHAAFVELSTSFYDRVYGDSEEWFRSVFATATKEDAIRNQYEFFIQRMGGPPLYSDRKGHPALIGRHGPYEVTDRTARRWLMHMEEALNSISTSTIDSDSKEKMLKYFKHTAFFLVSGKELMNGQRIVGYGGGKHLGGA